MIELKRLNKAFELSGQKIAALHDVSVSIARGEIFGVIGRSGAGKSTLVRCVNLLERPDTGQVIVAGEDLLTLSAKALRERRHQIGMVFQHFNLLQSQTVYDNVALPLRWMKKKRSVIRELVTQFLERVGLAAYEKAYPHQLSGGQKQRVAIARALVTSPSVLLCDEMTSALDPETTRSILDLLQTINEDMNLTILLITHEMDVVKRVCDRVAVLDGGRVIESGDVVSVFRAPKASLTKSLIQSAFHLALPEALESKMTTYPPAKGRVILRLSFVGERATQPVMSQLVERFKVSVNLLQADLETLRAKTMGMLIVALSGEGASVKAAMEHMVNSGLTVEVMGHVADDDWCLT